MIYLIGSLRNPRIPLVAKELRAAGFDVFDDWHAAGELADDSWQAYEKARGRSFAEALDGAHARDVFDFDKRHLLAADAVVLVAPAGKSGHIELGWSLGMGKPGFVLFAEDPDRMDIMYRFCDGVFYSIYDLTYALRGIK